MSLNLRWKLQRAQLSTRPADNKTVLWKLAKIMSLSKTNIKRYGVHLTTYFLKSFLGGTSSIFRVLLARALWLQVNSENLVNCSSKPKLNVDTWLGVHSFLCSPHCVLHLHQYHSLSPWLWKFTWNQMIVGTLRAKKPHNLTSFNL